MFCLKAPVCIHFSLCVRLSWNGRLIFSSISFSFFYFLSKISNVFTNMKNQKTNYLEQLYLTAHPDSPASSKLLSLLYKQIVRDNSDLNKSFGKKIKKKTHSVSVFETLQSFETSHYYLNRYFYFLVCAFGNWVKVQRPLIKVHHGICTKS